MRKWTLSIIIGVLLCILILLSWLYYTAKDDFADAERTAIRWALELTSMTEVDHVEYFAGATNFTIVFGNNDIGEPLIVWVNDERIHEEMASDGVVKSTIRKRVIERHGTVDFVHITPGELGDQWVWEVFYKKQDTQGTRHYYDYYTFKDGQWIDTYTLNLE